MRQNSFLHFFVALKLSLRSENSHWGRDLDSKLGGLKQKSALSNNSCAYGGCVHRWVIMHKLHFSTHFSFAGFALSCFKRCSYKTWSTFSRLSRQLWPMFYGWDWREWIAIDSIQSLFSITWINTLFYWKFRQGFTLLPVVGQLVDKMKIKFACDYTSHRCSSTTYTSEPRLLEIGGTENTWTVSDPKCQIRTECGIYTSLKRMWARTF